MIHVIARSVLCDEAISSQRHGLFSCNSIRTFAFTALRRSVTVASLVNTPVADRLRAKVLSI